MMEEERIFTLRWVQLLALSLDSAKLSWLEKWKSFMLSREFGNLS
jgi:hypothetical protein